MVRRWPASVGEDSRKSSLHRLREWRSSLTDRVGIRLWYQGSTASLHTQALSAFTPQSTHCLLSLFSILLSQFQINAGLFIFLEEHKRNLVFGRWGQLKPDAQWTHKLLPSECCVLFTQFFLWRNRVSKNWQSHCFSSPADLPRELSETVRWASPECSPTHRFRGREGKC